MNHDKEPTFISGISIIKQFFLLLLDFRRSVNSNHEVIDDALWFNMMTSVMSRVREECYLSDESSSDGRALYPIDNIVKNGSKPTEYPVNCMIIDPRTTSEEIMNCGVLIDVANPVSISRYKEFIKEIVTDEMNEDFVDISYSYTIHNFKRGKYTVYTNILLMHTLMDIYNEEILDTYYTIAGFAVPDINRTSTLLMRNVSLNMFLRILAESWSVELPQHMIENCESFQEFDVDDRPDAYVRLKVACKYPPIEEFTMDGTDIFRCKIIPSHIAIGVAS